MLIEKNNKHVWHAKRRRKRFSSLKIHRHLVRRSDDTGTFLDLKNINKKEQGNLKTWFAEKQKQTYHFEQELFKYCSNDMDNLRKCLLKMNSIKNVMEIEFLYDNQITILSSLSLVVFLQYFTYKDFLPITPTTGYPNVSKKNNKLQSQAAMLCLNDISRTVPNFRWKNHPKGETKIGKFFIDGYDPNTKTAYEFNGCFYHGCTTCFKPESFNPICRKTYKQLKNETDQRTKQIRLKCSKLIIIKECQFLKQLKEHKTSLKQEIEKQPQLQETFSINMHNAHYGGRTLPIYLYKDVFSKKGFKIFYIDFNSLYPFIQHKNDFPIKHPKTIMNEKECFEQITKLAKKTSSNKDGMGFAKCTILPPKKLFIPALPFRSNGKLVFPLCARCAKEKETKKCKHKDKQSSMNGTWYISKIHQAVKDGYKIQNVTQLLIYSQQEKIFANFIAKFYTPKQKYSGIPKNVQKKKTNSQKNYPNTS